MGKNVLVDNVHNYYEVLTSTGDVRFSHLS